jgi:hypothetical protein
MKPFILDYIVPRIGDDNHSDPAYYYDRNMAINVIVVNGQIVPFIEIDQAVTELMTKTKTEERETDDNHFSLLELETKSNEPRERDDREDLNLELQTKTLVKRENDDVRGMAFLELTTKTRVHRESDDEHFINN